MTNYRPKTKVKKFKNVMYLNLQPDLPRELPVYKFKNKLWYRDVRLGEYRSVKNPHERVPIDDVPNTMLQNPNVRRRKRRI